MRFKSIFLRCFLLSLALVSVGCAELKRLREDNAAMTRRLESLRSERDGLSSKYMASEREKSKLLAEHTRMENERRSLEQRLQGTGATVRVKGGKISITLPSSIFFNSGKITLKDAGKKSLQKVCGALKQDFPNGTIRIEGHTDTDPIKRTKGLYKSNWELSAMRAANVLHFLVGTCHIDPKKVYIAGFGEYQPVSNNKSRAGKQKNRRVEIVVVSE
ncbi:MAG: flagellar motor protein MotB [Planctomycetes bacterium]|nr:flagellar motor protein MotB [Planctomycetota bacterium]